MQNVGYNRLLLVFKKGDEDRVTINAYIHTEYPWKETHETVTGLSLGQQSQEIRVLSFISSLLF